MLRFLSIGLPLLIVLLAVFGVVIGALDLEPRSGAVIRLALFDQPQVAPPVVLGAWLMEACGLMAVFLLAQGRCGSWWLDGLVAGWVGWVFRGPLLVLTVVVATRQPQDPWWRLALAWWLLYSICGLALGWIGRATDPALAVAEVDSEEDLEVNAAAELLDVHVLHVDEKTAVETAVENAVDETLVRAPSAEADEGLASHVENHAEKHVENQRR